MTTPISSPQFQGVNAPDRTSNALLETAKELEVSFLTEMLKAMGLAKPPKTFSGSSGEGQFQSFLVRAYAREIVEIGGIGLTEQVFNQLEKMSDGK